MLTSGWSVKRQIVDWRYNLFRTVTTWGPKKKYIPEHKSLLLSSRRCVIEFGADDFSERQKYLIQLDHLCTWQRL
jgi:hypothetical protein